MTSKVIALHARRPSDNGAGFAQIDIEIAADGQYTVRRTGGDCQLADDRLLEAIRAMQMHILCMARDTTA